MDLARRKGPRRGRDNKSKWPVGVAEAVFGGKNFHCVRETVETVAEVGTVPVTPLKRGVNETLPALDPLQMGYFRKSFHVFGGSTARS